MHMLCSIQVRTHDIQVYTENRSKHMIYRFRLRTQFSEGTGKLEVHTDEKRQ